MNRPDTLEEAKIVALSVDASFNAFPLSQNGNNDKKMLYNNHKFNRNYDNKNNTRNNEKNSNQNSNQRNTYYNQNKNKQEKECYKCKKSWAPGHTCTNNSNQHSDRTDNRRTNYKQANTLYSALTARSQPNLILTTATINGVEIENCVLDTGASQSVISNSNLKLINIKTNNKLKKTTQPTKIKVANGQVVDCTITEKAQVIVAHKVTQIEFVVMEQDSHTLLGLDWFRQTKCMLDYYTGDLTFPIEKITASKKEEVENSSEIFVAEIDEEVLNEFSCWEDEPQTPIIIDNSTLKEEKTEIVKTIESYDVFADNYKRLGACSLGLHHISTENEKPIYVPHYRKSYKEREEINEEINKMLEAAIIRPSRSPWSFPVVQVPKTNGTRRFCVQKN